MSNVRKPKEGYRTSQTHFRSPVRPGLGTRRGQDAGEGAGPAVPCLGAALRCPAWARVVPCLGAGCPLAEANPGRRREEPGAWDPVLAWRPALSPCLPACPGRPALRAHLGSEVANGARSAFQTLKRISCQTAHITCSL